MSELKESDGITQFSSAIVQTRILRLAGEKWLPKALQEQVEKSELYFTSVKFASGPFCDHLDKFGFCIDLPQDHRLIAYRPNQFTMRKLGPLASGHHEGFDQQGDQMRILSFLPMDTESTVQGKSQLGQMKV